MNSLNFLQNKKNVVIVTGAGHSASAKMPTYRGPNGLYNQSTPDGKKIEEILHIKTLFSEPQVAWKYLSMLMCSSYLANPGPSHYLLKNLSDKIMDKGGSVKIFTQNVDGLQQKAGSSKVYELHGNIKTLRCLQCNKEQSSEFFLSKVCPLNNHNVLPLCGCDGILKPSIVLFGEGLPNKETTALNQSIYDMDCLIAIGTTAVFPYIKYPFVYAQQNNITSVEINPEKTALSDLVQIHLQEKAEVALESILQNYQN